MEKDSKKRLFEVMHKVTQMPLNEARGSYSGINPKYTHFAALKSNNKIVNGWDYSDYDSEELKSAKKEYFFQDIQDMDIDPKLVAIYTRKYLEKKGINPFDTNNWYKFEADNWRDKDELQEEDINRDNPQYQMGELESKYNTLLNDIKKLSEYLNQNPDIEAIKGFVNGMLGNYST